MVTLPLVDHGQCYAQTRRYVEALDDCNKTISLNPQDARAFYARGLAHRARKDYRLAIDDFKQAHRLDSALLEVDVALGWIYSTCPDERCRDRISAFVHADGACLKTNYMEPRALTVLAAMHADAGEFKEAMQWQKQVVEKTAGEEQEKARGRLKLHEEGTPCRDEEP